MRKLLDVVLLILTAGLFYLPPLCLFGVKENFVTLKGFEYPVKPESLSLDNYISKKYQSNFEKRFAMQFFMRKSFLKAKNQLYEWMNGGYFHSGYSGWIFTGRDGQLLERVYMTHYFGDFKFAETPDQVRNFIVIKQIADKLQAQGVDFVYVLAPDKVRMYPESLPAHLAVLEKRSGPIYAPYCAVAREKYRIPCFDAYSFLQPLKEKFELFPRRGTHWNALCAYLVADRIFRDLNVGKSAEARYPTPSMPKITRVSQSRYNDNDLQRLLNLIFDPEEYNVGTVPTFPRISPLPKEAIVLGDSFANIYASAALKWVRTSPTLRARAATSQGAAVRALYTAMAASRS